MNRIVFVCVFASLVVVAIGYGGGGDSSSEEDSRFSGHCQCSTTKHNRRTRTTTTTNLCANNTGATIMCGRGTTYLTCNDTTCSSVNCSANTLWNQTQKACVSCAAGFHIDTTYFYARCICDKGTTFNHTLRACIACAASATVLDYVCFCDPTGATPFLSVKDNACKGCPGNYVSVNYDSINFLGPPTVRTRQVCQCPGTNDIFDVISVSCLTCPANSTAVKSSNPFEKDWCDCKIRAPGYDPMTSYNRITNTCSCPPYLVLNAAGTVCERSP